MGGVRVHGVLKGGVPVDRGIVVMNLLLLGVVGGPLLVSLGSLVLANGVEASCSLRVSLGCTAVSSSGISMRVASQDMSGGMLRLVGLLSGRVRRVLRGRNAMQAELESSVGLASSSSCVVVAV